MIWSAHAGRMWAAVSHGEFGGTGVSDDVSEFLVREMNSNERTVVARALARFSLPG